MPTRICPLTPRGFAWLVVPLIAAMAQGAAGQEDAANRPVTVTAWFAPPGPDRRAELYVAANVHPAFHIYSLTQPPGGPNRSQIRLTPSHAYRLVGDFVAVTPPKVTSDPHVLEGLSTEEHRGRTVWRATVELSSEANAAELAIQGRLWAQADNDEQRYCLAPADYSFTAVLADGPAVRCTFVPRRRPFWLAARSARWAVACCCPTRCDGGFYQRDTSPCGL
jgi:hypothetical protein